MTAKAPPAPDAPSRRISALDFFLVLMVVVMPNLRRFSFSILPGLNLLNILFMFVLYFMHKEATERADKRPSPSAPAGGYMLFFWVVSFMAMINAMLFSEVSASMNDVIFYKNHIFYMGLYFVYFHAVRTRRSLDLVYWTLIIVTAIAGLEAVRQRMSFGGSGYSTGVRVSGPFGAGWENSNVAGVFYAQFASIIFAEMLFQKKKLLKLGLLGGFIIAVMGLFYTYSRKAYYAFAAAAVLMGATVSKWVLVVITAVVLTFPLWAPESAVERLMGNAEEKADHAGPDESTESRYILWAGAMSMWQDHPVGVGLERFKHYIGQYSPISNLDAHNYYVLVFAEMGPLGEFAYLLMVFMMYREGAKLGKVARTPREKALASGFRGTMVSYIICNTFGSAFNFGEMMGNLWVLAGLVSRMRLMIEQEIADEKKKSVPARSMMA